MPAIEIRELTKRFGSTLAVDRLSFTVDEGTICGFLGPNGAGKTTTFRMLLGLAQPTSGEALVLGRPYRQLEDPVRTVGALLEASGLHPGRRGRSHLRYLTTVSGLPTSRIDEVLEMVGLTPAGRRRARTYSLGMRQRLALAAALIGDPRILVLDEPANGLDPEGMRWLRSFLRDQASAGRTIVISSHVLAEVAQTVDEVVIVNQGRLVAHSSVADLSARTGRVRVRCGDVTALAEVLRERGLTVGPASGDELFVDGTGTDLVGAVAAEHGIPVYELGVETAGLEDIYLTLTGSEERR
ncbi:MAG TPA: ATP-binding cassette domain-containing protein [Acidimicrobiales bacterium]|nr:ATP-binding cassette domain-containing protein [Acidimicrobiales bacterium]